MASLTHQSTSRTGWRLQAYDVDNPRRRHSVWLGDIPDREARKIKQHIEAVIESRKLSTPTPGQTQRWLSKQSAGMLRKLAPMLGSMRTASEAAAEYLDYATNRNKKSTVSDASATLAAFGHSFGGQQLRSLLASDVDGWLDRLNVTANTVAKHAKNLKTFFAWCVRQGWMDAMRLDTASTVSVGAKNMIPADDLQRWIDALGRSIEHRCAMAIARWSGVRVPSELAALVWAHVDWENKRLHVPDHKRTKRSSRGPPRVRVTPLFAELLPYVTRLWDARGDDDPQRPLLPSVADDPMGFVATARHVRDDLNLHWPRLFTSVRATRETELIAQFGLQPACEWIGNSPTVAMRNYAMITEATWTEATG